MWREIHNKRDGTRGTGLTLLTPSISCRVKREVFSSLYKPSLHNLFPLCLIQKYKQFDARSRGSSEANSGEEKSWNMHSLYNFTSSPSIGSSLCVRFNSISSSIHGKEAVQRPIWGRKRTQIHHSLYIIFFLSPFSSWEAAKRLNQNETKKKATKSLLPKRIRVEGK